MDKQLLSSAPEAAGRLSISRAKLYKLIKPGVILSVRIDGARPAASIRRRSSKESTKHRPSARRHEPNWNRRPLRTYWPK